MICQCLIKRGVQSRGDGGRFEEVRWGELNVVVRLDNVDVQLPPRGRHKDSLINLDLQTFDESPSRQLKSSFWAK